VNAKTVATAGSSPPLVAIVDDEESVRVATEGFIRSIGHRTESFPSAEEFLLRAGGLEEIRCLILDVRLHGMDGLTLQEWLGAAGLRIPIILITAHWNEALCARALKFGAVDVLRKPFSEVALLRALGLAFRAGRELHHEE
jgi:FixJ family two-component response regulator